MSTSIFCDLCGEKIEYSNNNHKITTEYVGLYGYVEEHYDMCEKCFNKINDKIVNNLYRRK